MARPLILVVEDDRALCDLYRVALGLSGYDVHVCEDGLDALRYLDEHRPDVIVLDLDLPRVSGMTLHGELRVNPNMQKIPIIVVTGVDPTPMLANTRVCRKPCEPDSLIEEIERVLGGSSLV